LFSVSMNLYANDIRGFTQILIFKILEDQLFGFM
jgi:hypothetical protein